MPTDPKARWRQILWVIAASAMVILLVLALPRVGRSCDQPAICTVGPSGECEPGPCDRQAQRDRRDIGLILVAAVGVAVTALVLDRRLRGAH